MLKTALTDHYKKVVSNTLLLAVVSIHKNMSVLVMGTTSDTFDIWLIFLEVRSGEICYWHNKLLSLDHAVKSYGVSQLRFRSEALHHNDLEFKYQNRILNKTVRYFPRIKPETSCFRNNLKPPVPLYHSITQRKLDEPTLRRCYPYKQRLREV